jgi:hypothetical protein
MTDAAPIEAPRTAGTALGLLRARVVGVRPVSKRRRAVAVAIALAADVIQLVLWPAFAEGAASPFEDALDVVVAIALWLTLGMSWRLAFAFALELVPGADLFPTWTAVVLTFPAEEASAAKELPPSVVPIDTHEAHTAHDDGAPASRRPM